MSVDSLERPPNQAVAPPMSVVIDRARAAEFGLSEDDALRLQQLAAGWEQKAMAKQAWVTRSAINMRFARMRERVGARTNPQLVAWGYQHGVLGVPRG